MHASIHLSTIHSSIHLSIIHPSTYSSIHPSTHIHTPTHNIHPITHPSIHLLIPLSQTLTTTSPLSVSVDLPVLDISHQWSHTPCVLLCLLFSLSITCSRSIHIVACVRAPLLFIPLCGPHSLHPSIPKWLLKLLPSLGDSEQHGYEQSGTSFHVDTCFQFSCVNTKRCSNGNICSTHMLMC